MQQSVIKHYGICYHACTVHILSLDITRTRTPVFTTILLSPERMLAAQNPLTQMDRPHQLFADAPPIQPLMPPAMPPTFMTPTYMTPIHVPPMGKPVDNSCCNHFLVEQHCNMVATVTYRLCYMYIHNL